MKIKINKINISLFLFFILSISSYCKDKEASVLTKMLVNSVNTLAKVISETFLEMDFLNHETVQAARSVIYPQAMSLLMIFVLIEFMVSFRAAGSGNVMEVIATPLLTLFAGRFLIRNMDSILEYMMKLGAKLTKEISLGKLVDADSITKFYTEVGGIKAIIYEGLMVMLLILILVSFLLVVITLINRAIKLAGLYAIAPIYVSFVANPYTRTHSINFLMSFLTTSLEIFFIFLNIAIYANLNAIGIRIENVLIMLLITALGMGISVFMYAKRFFAK